MKTDPRYLSIHSWDVVPFLAFPAVFRRRICDLHGSDGVVAVADVVSHPYAVADEDVTTFENRARKHSS